MLFRSIADLESARLNISNTLSERATVEAATALLASISLTRGNAENALLFANQVLQSFPMLETSYEALFSSNTAPAREILFYVPFSATDKNRLAEYNFPNTLGGRHENAPSSVLINIDSSDKRKALIAASHGDKYYTKKYADLTTGSDRVIVLRTAEMYLIRAEAHYLIDSVGNLAVILSDINTIRNRAGLSPVIADTITSLRNIIEREKQIEFAFEGKRWFDLIRTGRAVDLVPTVTQEWQMLFPIPLSEILTNNKISVEDQNEGY